MCVPSVVTPILGGSLFSLGLWVAFTFWTIPGPFKEVEDHLSLPSSSLGWKLLFLRPVIHSRIPIVPTLSRGLANILRKLWLEDSAVLTAEARVFRVTGTWP